MQRPSTCARTPAEYGSLAEREDRFEPLSFRGFTERYNSVHQTAGYSKTIIHHRRSYQNERIGIARSSAGCDRIFSDNSQFDRASRLISLDLRDGVNQSRCGLNPRSGGQENLPTGFTRSDKDAG